LIQVYTGEGKGKTTACLGLALRASGAGLNVFIAQFVKGIPCSEHKALGRLKNVSVKQYGRGRFIKGCPSRGDIEAAQKGLSEVKKIIASGKYRLIILDEINVAFGLRLIEPKEVLKLMRSAPQATEFVLSGRGAPDCIIAAADLVSEILPKKHYFNKRIKSRRGIEF